MSECSLNEFLHDFRQEVMAAAAANMDFFSIEFTQKVTDELMDSGVIGGFEPSHHRSPSGGMRVDGFWFNDNDMSLELFVSDVVNRDSLQSLTQTDVTQIFKRLESFFIASIEKKLYQNLEETSQGYGLSRQISERKSHFSKVSFFLISERELSKRVHALDDKEYKTWTFSYNICDISRMFRLRSSKGAREELEIDLTTLTNGGLPCLPAHLHSAYYRSYLLVIPASILVELYGKYGARLLEQNVRSFLQVRGNVNKGIRTTILNDPEMFFAYNNGITATAREVETVQKENGILLTSLKDLQIVNGGQTTASLFHTYHRDKASLDNIFVQMKLSVVNEDKSEEIVPKISEYANTQNKINAADFFSNHPYHIRMEEFSRRIWAPSQQRIQRETKWFYERARGQYADAQSKLVQGKRKIFQAEYPKHQMFTKTDLAKFENVWDDNPVYVNLGAQKNFAFYAARIGHSWSKNTDCFNEFYFQRAIARAIIFKATEKLVSAQGWYNGGYRANIVAYTIAMLAKVCDESNMAFDFIKIWDSQELSFATVQSIQTTAKMVHDDIMNPMAGVSNISEWCKKGACWDRLQTKVNELIPLLPAKFFDELVSKDEESSELKSAAKIQKLDSGIEAQKKVINITAQRWAKILTEGQKKGLYSPKEIGILEIAAKIPLKIPSEKQSFLLLDILERAKTEGIY